MKRVNGSNLQRQHGLGRRALIQWLGIGLLGSSLSASCKQQSGPTTDSKRKKILIVLTNHEKLGDTGRKTGFYLSEVSHPYEEFKKAGLEVDFVSPTGGVAPMDGVDRNDPTNAAFLDNADSIALTKNTLAARDVDANKYDAVFYAGGHGAMWDLPTSAALQSLTAKIYERGGIVAAVCHGPAGIVNVKLANGTYLVAGKRVTSFTNAEEQARDLTDVVPFLLETTLKERGADFSGAPNFEEHVVVSERLATGQNPASARKLAQTIVKLLAP